MIRKDKSLSKLEIIRHGFFSRIGGVSKGVYHSLNCGLGSKDDKNHVIENRRRAMLCLGLPITSLRTVYQIHSDLVLTIDGDRKSSDFKKADALVTATSGIALGVLTADCAPVLLADPFKGVIGASHSGWRGAYKGVISSTVEAMVNLKAKKENIIAVIGPCISQASYEVDAIFLEKFEKQNSINRKFFIPGRRGHFHFDLKGYTASRLKETGVTKINALNIDSYEDDNFFSYRKARHKNESDYGRNISVIALNQTT